MQRLILCCALTGLCLTPVSADPAKLKKGSDAPETEIPVRTYFAGVRAARNVDSLFPDLDYWGVGRATWGASKAQLRQAGLPEARLQSNCRVAIYKCELSQSYVNGELDRYSYRFANGITDRALRVKAYKTLKRELIRRYGPASDHPLPDEEVRGEDSFVQGLDEKYEIKWNGPETNVGLVLTAEQLSIEFSRAPGSNAGALTQSYRDFEALVSKLPKNHYLLGPRSRH